MVEYSTIQPIHNESVLFIKNHKTLVVADLHIGIEKELREQGLNIASQSKTMTNHLISLCRKYKPKKIVILGDVKHNIPSSTIGERRDVKNFLEKIQAFGEIHIVPGNHDGNIKKITPKVVVIHSSAGFVIDDIGFTHGHRWPSRDIMSCGWVVVGHTHPTIMLTDRLGYKTYEPCWLKGKTIKNKMKDRYPDSIDVQMLVMPAFNLLCGGISANVEGVTGPIGKIMDVDNAIVYLLDGSCLGKVKDIS